MLRVTVQREAGGRGAACSGGKSSSAYQEEMKKECRETKLPLRRSAPLKREDDKHDDY